MFKKLVLITAAVLSMLSISAQAWSNDEITMLVMPREVLPLQIAQDISRRYPVMIVSYQMNRGNLQIHAWNGDSWVTVSTEDYTNGTFFAVRPKHAIIVENARLHAPAVLTPNSAWCGSANRLESTDPRILLHLLGLYFDFPYRHWDQMAKRYGYALEEINPTLHNVHWWNLRGDVLIEKRSRRNFSVDLDKWYYLEPTPAPVIEPVKLEEEAPAPIAPVVPVVEPAGAPDVNITAKAPDVAAVKKVPAVKPAAPAPRPEPTPVVELPAPEPAPVAEAAPVETVETAVAEAAPETVPAPVIIADPFSAEEIPAAELIVPPEPKKPWWKFF